MKALILAAGRGTRVRPLTDLLPKPMIPVIHKPVMAFLVEHLKRFGIDRIMVNTSYMSSQIEQYFRDGTGFGVEMAYSFEGRLEYNQLMDEPLGSAGAIRKIHNHSGFFDETFIVLCGNAVIDLDIGELLEFHRRKGALATIALVDVAREEVASYGVVVQDGDGRITEFQEKPRPEDAKSSTINTGIYIFESEVLNYIPDSGPFDIGGQFCVDTDGTVLDARNTDTTWLLRDSRATTDALNPARTKVLADIGHFTGPRATPGFVACAVE